MAEVYVLTSEGVEQLLALLSEPVGTPAVTSRYCGDDPARLAALQERLVTAVELSETERLYVHVGRLASRIGLGIVAVQNGEPEDVILGMLRGELRYDHDAVVRA